MPVQPREFILPNTGKSVRETIGQKIKAERARLDMTQTDLAHACGLSERSIWTYERGMREPSLTDLYFIAVALNLKPDDLVPPLVLVGATTRAQRRIVD